MAPLHSGTATTPSQGSSLSEPLPCYCLLRRTWCPQSAPIPMIKSTTKTWQLWEHHAVEVFIILQLYHGKVATHNKGPPIQLLFQCLWTIYLGFYALGPIMTDIWQLYIELMPFAIICAKIVLKYYVLSICEGPAILCIWA
jgi:hypothetical protein